MTELAEYRRRLIDRYARQPHDLAGVIDERIGGRLRDELEPGGWSAHQVLVHLRDVEARAFVPRVEKILESQSPKLEGFDPEAWMDGHYDPDESVEAILMELGELRLRGSEMLGRPAQADWNRTGEHPRFGIRTLQWWIEYAVSHFEEHLEQLTRARRA